MKAYNDEKAEDSPLISKRGKIKPAGLLVGKKPSLKFGSSKASTLSSLKEK